MKQFTTSLEVASNGKGLYDFTSPVARWIGQCHITTGLLTLFCQHTSASLTIQENADPDVIADLTIFSSVSCPKTIHSTAIRWKVRTTCRRISVPRLRRPTWQFP
jgi:secondary thiamine-phosphate synthase enzyme